MGPFRWWPAAAVVLAWTLVWPAAGQTHPHNENQIVTVTGTLVNVDLATKTIMVTAYDRDTKSSRTAVLFLDPQVKLRQGKRRVALTDLTAGLHVTCTAEKELDQDSRLVAFEISIEAVAR